MRSQTSTEYLILGAVVIIIALIVIAVLGGVPSIGGASSDDAHRAQLRSMEVGIAHYAVSEQGTVFALINNQNRPVHITSVSIDGVVCEQNIMLSIGQSRQFTCAVTESGRYELPIDIEWRDGLLTHCTQQMQY